MRLKEFISTLFTGRKIFRPMKHDEENILEFLNIKETECQELMKRTDLLKMRKFIHGQEDGSEIVKYILKSSRTFNEALFLIIQVIANYKKVNCSRIPSIANKVLRFDSLSKKLMDMVDERFETISTEKLKSKAIEKLYYTCYPHTKNDIELAMVFLYYYYKEECSKIRKAYDQKLDKLFVATNQR